MPHRYDILTEDIIRIYFDEGKNRRQTAEILNCSEDLIWYRIKKLGLKMKSMDECVFASLKRIIEFDEEIMNILDGEMLGDAYIYFNHKQGSFRESVGFDKYEWAEYLFNLFNKIGIPFVGNKIYYKKPSGKSKNHSYHIMTRAVTKFAEIHSRWYIKNENFNETKPFSFDNRKYIKIVPKDLILTPKALLHWYIGDGAPSESDCCNIHTEGFSYEGVEFLRYLLLKTFNIFSSHPKNKNIIYLPATERYKLLDIIGLCPVQCYEYKWVVNRKPRKFKVNTNIDMKLIENYLY